MILNAILDHLLERGLPITHDSGEVTFHYANLAYRIHLEEDYLILSLATRYPSPEDEAPLSDYGWRTLFTTQLSNPDSITAFTVKLRTQLHWVDELARWGDPKTIVHCLAPR